jgi:hypothetical protein
LTYQEIFDWIDEEYGYYEPDDLGELYETISEEWTGRNNFSDIISFDEFINHYEA